MTARARGQALVLFALTLLVLTVMVMITLSMGMKAKERMELQTLADASAYSNAVATARTFNALAIMNRVQVAHTVSTLGNISLISWATLYYSHARTAAILFDEMAEPYDTAVGLACFFLSPFSAMCLPCTLAWLQMGLARSAMNNHANAVRLKLRQDANWVFTPDINRRWQAMLSIYQSQQALRDTLISKLGEPGGVVGNELLAAAALFNPGAVTSSDATQAVNQRELTDALLERADQFGPNTYHFGRIAMASRGNPWLRARAYDTPQSDPNWSWELTQKVLLRGGACDVDRDGSKRGRGYLASNFPAWSTAPTGNPGEVRADDFGRVQCYVGPLAEALGAAFFDWSFCFLGVPLIAANLIGHGGLKSETRVSGRTGAETSIHRAIHAAGSSNQQTENIHPAITEHAKRTVPPFVDLDHSQLANPENLYGQPKNYAAFVRDYSSSAEPWDLNFRFHLTSPGEQIDLAGATTFGAPLMTALGTGVVYYHRRDRYAETPNLFMPYWRAGLTRLTIDRGPSGSGQPGFDGELADVLDGLGGADFSQAYQSLRANGYLGFD
jgi:hypothetical protein